MTQQHSDIARSAIIGSMSLYSSEPSSLKNQDIPQTNGVHESNSGEAKGSSSNGLHGNSNEGVDGSAKSDVSDNSNGSDGKDSTLMPPPKSVIGRALGSNMNGVPTDKASLLSFSNGVGKALTDTPISTAPPSPQMYVIAPLPRASGILHGPASSLGPDRLQLCLPLPLCILIITQRDASALLCLR